MDHPPRQGVEIGPRKMGDGWGVRGVGCRWSFEKLMTRSQVLEGCSYLPSARNSCSAKSLPSAARSMEDLPAADAPIKVYENTYITKPNDNQR